MTLNVRAREIEYRLQEAFQPTYLEIQDDSAQHIGHASAGGAGHFSVKIISSSFEGLSRLARHRAVFAAVESLLGTEVHALSVIARTPEEEL
ncbi:BolA family protein [Suttonella ornithocola]|uniref:Transcriptional regulator BolA n=1 Tax=Suttonella ornithocola TaxID=279832 RepID=A0A380MQ27_9GAMM|nr:BolA family protein [Suttonella ornithocola]SUO93417.1 transcriptional regulator BolA [Suttonella ornithocola]